MKLQSLIPILYSTDVLKSLAYYTEVLGFTGKWQWDHPATLDIAAFKLKNGNYFPQCVLIFTYQTALQRWLS